MKISDKTDRLLSLGLRKDILNHYLEPHRFYHTLEHLDDICDQLEKKGLGENDALLLATVFHDIIYDPRSPNNEEDSASYFNKVFSGSQALKDDVTQIIWILKLISLKVSCLKYLAKQTLIFCNNHFID